MSRIIKALAAFLAVALTAPIGAASDAVPATAPGPVTAVVGADYVIGPGDALQIYVWRNPELNATVPVLPDGRISTPLVDSMVAAGKSPSVLAADIEKVLAEFVISPEVNVIVTHAASALSQVKVMGQVVNPQALPYREGMTVLDALLAVGGLKEFAAGNRAKLLRNEGGKEVDIPVRLGRLLNDGDLSQNRTLRPGDVLHVPLSRF